MTENGGTPIDVCSGSGLNPSRYPTFDDHQRVECHKCGQVVRVFQRYYDGPRDVRNLALEAHKPPQIDEAGRNLDEAIRAACLPNMRKAFAGEPLSTEDIESEQAALDVLLSIGQDDFDTAHSIDTEWLRGDLMTQSETDVLKSEPRYPEHEKQAAALADAQVIGDFLTWLESSDGPKAFVAVWVKTIEERCTRRRIEPHRVTRCEGGQWVDHWGDQRQVLGGCRECGGTGYVTRERIEPVAVPSAFSIQSLLALYFGIDLDKIEAERRTMLDDLRAANSAADQQPERNNQMNKTEALEKASEAIIRAENAKESDLRHSELNIADRWITLARSFAADPRVPADA